MEKEERHAALKQMKLYPAQFILMQTKQSKMLVIQREVNVLKKATV